MSGSIPDEIGLMSSLTFLNINDVRVRLMCYVPAMQSRSSGGAPSTQGGLSGALPPVIATLPLKYVYLNGNNFQGPFPDGWASLAQLAIVGSSFTGSLPGKLLSSPLISSM